MKICLPKKKYTLDDIGPVVDSLLELVSSTSVVGLTGSLGAGKTTLVQQLLRRCGVTQEIASPTFSYVHTYRVGEQLFHHFDLYRLKTMDDFIQAGFDEYLYQPDSKVFIEWPEIIMPLLTHDACVIALEYVSADERVMTVCCTD